MLSGALLHTYIDKLISKIVIIETFNWLATLGIIFTVSSFLLYTSRFKHFRDRYLRRVSLVEITLIFFLLSSTIFTGGFIYGQYEKTLLIKSQNINIISDQVNMINKMGTIAENSSLNNKKIIIRNDDVGLYSSNKSLEWLSNLTYDKKIKITYAVVPLPASKNMPLLYYLNNLSRNRFELAVHGYEHESLYGKPYEEQLSLITNSTNLAEKYSQDRPYTFVPPYNKGDINTTKVCRILGYHTITDVRGYPLYLKNMKSSFNWEKEYQPPKHQSFEEFKDSFDSFYNSSEEYFVICVHDWTFLGENGELDSEKTANFEKAVEYMLDKNVQFMTIEEAYRWSTDENDIVYELINDSSYFVDLRECNYNHTIIINQMPMIENATIYNVDTQEMINSKFGVKYLEFEAQKGYLYYIQYEPIPKLHVI